nr:EAL domain-containing protein [Eubacterium sp.]
MEEALEKSMRQMKCGYDSLTGIYDLDTFKVKTSSVLNSQDSELKFALLYTDITHFERVNNLYGRQKADTLLIDLAQKIAEIDFGLELYCRSVADHFVLLLSYEDRSILGSHLEEFCRSFNAMAVERFPEAVPHLALGAYLITDLKEPLEDMVEKANEARKSLRERTSLNVLYYNPAEAGKKRRAKEIERDMLRAMERGEFKVYLQPKFDLTTKEIVGAEALVRWIRDDGSMVYPDEFIPVFERNGFIRQLDFYMLKQVCGMLKRRLAEGKKCIPISINQSRVLLDSDTYTTDVAYVLSSFNTPPNLIELELTERIFTDALDEMAQMMDVLKKLGIRWSIDDFGTGYSSLNLLKKLPVDIIKIDKAFLDETETSNVSRIIIRKTVELTRALDKVVVCEGVETEAQARYLREIRCDVAQGYLYAKPMPMTEFETLVDTQGIVA